MPLPRLLSATGERHRVRTEDRWRILTPRHAPAADLEGHLTFALKYEGLDLAVLKRLFAATGPALIEAIVRAAPTGRYVRRIWFLYECLTGVPLDLPDADQGSSCVKQTIEVDLPRETEFLAGYDRFRARIEGLVDMPERTVDLLFRFLHQNGGSLSRRARGQKFAELTDAEAAAAEAAYRKIFQEA